MADPVKLIVGLANPGAQYADTRHNAGAWYVNALARSRGVSLSEDRKYFGLTGSFTEQGETVRLLIPTTFMNRSGQATAALANFFRIPVTQMLVAHDELDLAPGCIRLKIGGGHGGHNGLRDIVSRHGNQKDFVRLRIGIGHPGNAALVTPHVLGKPSQDDRILIERAIDEALRYTGEIVSGELPRAMNGINSFKPQ
ncbi:peptidyl-tRNA hydrolase [Isoalcanivorax pacificus W11-5]|uniref:Peptidyl-tRNA hydrolase n=1 Tax=Isoalcanivorax pacificus W11-5 TaxID=391936 RepID=A0A0B4XRJ4_9GAMM|nr:aminoacyl-tRNA hydrolase [Isoalcanivorax pacificus]AJD49048.1 peptidyl-tRNA hydrolase [Isoalcanivorax pacificus W11-5]